MSEKRREPEVPEARLPVVECFDGPARITSKELAPIHSVKKWHPPECFFCKTNSGCKFVEKCSYAHRQVDERPSKRSKNGDKSAVAVLKITRQVGCCSGILSKSSSILRKSSNMQKPIQRVRFTKVAARHAKNRDQNPSLGMVCPGEPHQRSPNAPKFEDRSQEETEWQEQGAREAAWKLAKSVLNLKEKNKATFFSPSENRWPACINS